MENAPVLITGAFSAAGVVLIRHQTVVNLLLEE